MVGMEREAYISELIYPGVNIGHNDYIYTFGHFISEMWICGCGVRRGSFH